MTTKTKLNIAAGLVLLCLLFPPVEVVRSYEPHVAQGDGFAFIGGMGPRQRILYAQWVIQIVGLAATAMLLTRAPEKTQAAA